MKVRQLLEDLSLARLRDICRARGLSPLGAKARLQERLARSSRGDAKNVCQLMSRTELIECLSEIYFTDRGATGEFTYLRQTTKSDLETLACEVFGGSSILFKLGEQAPLGEDSKVRIRWQEPELPELRIYSTHFTSGDVEKLSYETLLAIFASASSISIASAFYSVDFFKKLFVNLPALRNLRIVVDGLTGPRLRLQQDELRALHNELSKIIEAVEIRLVYHRNGLFHSKLFLVEEDLNTFALVGSANATAAAMGRNEEILVRLPYSELLEQYFNLVWNSASSLNTQQKYVRTLRGFFRNGKLYFKTSASLTATVNPFAESISLLETVDKAKLQKISLPYSDPKGVLAPFDLRDALAISKEDMRSKEVRVSIRSFSIETCFGYWIPSVLCDEFEVKCDEASKPKEQRLLTLLGKLKNSDCKELMGKYKEYITKARESLKELGIKIPKGRLDPFNSDNWFKGRIKTLIQNLSNEQYRKRLSQPFSWVHMPDLRNDPMSATDFEQSFFEYVAYVGTLTKQKPRIAKMVLNFANKGSDYSDPQSAIILQKNFVEHLTERGVEIAEWSRTKIMGNKR